MLSPASPAFIDHLASLLPHGTLRNVREGELDDPRGRHQGQGAMVACPATTEEVATIVKACNDARVGVVPLGGSTGLVLGQVSFEGPLPLILSLEKMTKIRALYPEENAIVVEAGAILANIQNAAEEIDRLFPLSLASEGSCQIGGNLATNAGGLNVLRYGNTRDLCLGVEAVLPDGTIYNGLKRLRKDNTGYDIRNLLIGSEGTLGVITAASLRLYPRPASEAAAFLAVPSPQAALDLLALAQKQIGECISAFELISGIGLAFLRETMPDVPQPFAQTPAWSVMMDVGVSGGDDAREKLEQLFEAAHENGFVTDGVLSQSEAQRAEFWATREAIPLANKKVGSISSHDISVPLSRIPEFIPTGIKAMQALGDMRVNCFGHLGDGNLHYNIFPAKGRSRADYDDIRPLVKRGIHELVHAFDGSVSAEHGIGRLKVEDLERYSDPGKLAAIRAIKKALDPNGIMNPGAIVKD